MAFREGFNPSAFPDWAWFLEQWKNTLNKLDEIGEDNERRLHAAEQLANDLKTFVNSYFDNLDVQQEINKKIDLLVASGRFLQIAEPTIAANVTDWLIDNITEPEGVIIDRSLSVSGACADAKATGDTIKNLNGDVVDINKALDTGYQETEKHLYGFRQGNIENGIVTEGRSVWMFSHFVPADKLKTAFCENGYLYRVHGYDANYNYINTPKATNTTGAYNLPAGYAYFIFQIATSTYSYDITAQMVYDNFYVVKNLGYKRIEDTIEAVADLYNAQRTEQYHLKLQFEKGWVATDGSIDYNSGLLTQKIPKRDIAYIRVAPGYVIRQITTDDEHDSLGGRIQYVTAEELIYNPRNVRTNMTEYEYIRISIKNSAYVDITVAEAEKAITVIMNDETPPRVIPAYFLPQCNLAVRSVQNNMRNSGKNSATFIFMTDVHWSINNQRSPELVRYITDRLPINNVICGGDIIENGTKINMLYNMQDFVNHFHFLGDKFKVMFGNHDTNTVNTTDPSQYLTKAEFEGICQKQMVNVNFGVQSNFWYDEPATNTRYIFMDTGTDGYAMNAAQIAWAENLLATNYNVLVFAHLLWQTDRFTGAANDLFTMLDTHSNVKAVFTGHLHKDMVEHTPGGIPVVLFDCDATTTIGTYPNVNGTKDEQAFDIVTVDYTNNVINCVRIGRGVNRTITMN